MIDNRVNEIKGNISSMNDIDEIFREICSHHGKNLTTMRTFTKSSKGFNMRSIMLLCLELNCKLTIDPALDRFKIEYADADQAPIENPPVDESEEEAQGLADATGKRSDEIAAEIDGADPANTEDDEFVSVGSEEETTEEPKENNDAELFP